MRRQLWMVGITVAFLVVLVVGVLPTRTFLAQRASLSRVQDQIAVLGEQNRLLEERTDRLRDDDEIERLAREEYHLVRPGEESYVVLPPPTSQPEPADDEESSGQDNPLAQAWSWITDRF